MYRTICAGSPTKWGNDFYELLESVTSTTNICTHAKMLSTSNHSWRYDTEHTTEKYVLSSLISFQPLPNKKGKWLSLLNSTLVLSKLALQYYLSTIFRNGLWQSRVGPQPTHRSQCAQSHSTIISPTHSRHTPLPSLTSRDITHIHQADSSWAAAAEKLRVAFGWVRKINLVFGANAQLTAMRSPTHPTECYVFKKAGKTTDKPTSDFQVFTMNVFYNRIYIYICSSAKRILLCVCVCFVCCVCFWWGDLLLIYSWEWSSCCCPIYLYICSIF